MEILSSSGPTDRTDRQAAQDRRTNRKIRGTCTIAPFGGKKYNRAEGALTEEREMPTTAKSVVITNIAIRLRDALGFKINLSFLGILRPYLKYHISQYRCCAQGKII